MLPPSASEVRESIREGNFYVVNFLLLLLLLILVYHCTKNSIRVLVFVVEFMPLGTVPYRTINAGALP